MPTMNTLPALSLLCLSLLVTPLSLAMPQGHDAGGSTAAAGDACSDVTQPASLRCARAPSVVFDAMGRLWLAWAQGGHVYVQHTDDRGVTYSDALVVNAVPEQIAADGENRPKIALGGNGNLYVSWTRSGKQRYTGDVRFARSVDSGRSFAAPITVNDNTDPISHRFESMSVAANGDITLVWIDKRDAAAAKQRGQDYPGAALYFTVSRDGGASFATNRKLFDNSCECCRLVMARDTDGDPVILWRHVFAGQIRDHALVKLVDGDQPGPLRRASVDNWQVNACPHHGPALSIAADGRYHLAWFTGVEKGMGLYYASSQDQGVSYSPAMRFGGPDAAHPQVHVEDGKIYLVWKAARPGATTIHAQHSTDGGRSWSQAQAVATTQAGSDHPHVVSDGKTVYLSWQTRNEGYRLLPIQ